MLQGSLLQFRYFGLILFEFLIFDLNFLCFLGQFGIFRFELLLIICNLSLQLGDLSLLGCILSALVLVASDWDLRHLCFVQRVYDAQLIFSRGS